MKGLYRCLSPFAPDQSGAVSVLFELGGLIIVLDAGGCTGNICGFDEPRWFTRKSALFSAGVRDMDAIMGRDDRLMGKIEDALSRLDCNFIALIGTPVPSVIGTDFRALKRLAEKKFGLPVLTIETTGMDYYDRGQEKAYLSLFETFASGSGENAPEIGIIGATPLDLPGLANAAKLVEQFRKLGYGRVACYGMGSGLDEIKKAGAAHCNLVVSPSGVKAAEWLMEKFGVPYGKGIPLTDQDAEEMKLKIDAVISGSGSRKIDASTCEGDGKILIIHQQYLANALRKKLCKIRPCVGIDAASWFMLDETVSEDGDVRLREEDDLMALLQQRGYRVVAGDPLLKRAIHGWQGEFIDLPHYPVSGGIFGDTNWEKALNRLKSAVHNLER